MLCCACTQGKTSNYNCCNCGPIWNVKPVITTVAPVDIYALGKGYYSTGATIGCNALLQGGYYSRGLLIDGVSIRGNMVCVMEKKKKNNKNEMYILRTAFLTLTKVR